MDTDWELELTRLIFDALDARSKFNERISITSSKIKDNKLILSVGDVTYTEIKDFEVILREKAHDK